MSVDKLVDSTLLDAACTYEAGKIREKLGSSAQIAYDLANGKGFGDAIAAIPSGGGGSAETGSFVATTSDTLTISVTSLHNYLAVWKDGWTLGQSLSDNPYGAYKKLCMFVISPDCTDVSALAGMIAAELSNYAGTAYSGYIERAKQIGGGNVNNVEFTSSSISLTSMRVGGSNRTFVDGATYNWRAW